VSFEIRGDSKTDSFPVYTVKDHTKPEIDLSSVDVFIPNYYDFSVRNCLKDRQLFHSMSDLSVEMSYWG
jgi:hypothetical protein